MIADMRGKAPLLLASVLFSIGALGLVLTSAERADWGPFQPGPAPQKVVVFNAGHAPVEPPALAELFASGETLAATGEPVLAAAPELPASPEPADPTPTPIPPLRVFGISADDAGVSAAAVTPSPVPIRIGGIASDDEPPQDTATPAATETPSPEPTAVPGTAPE